MGWKIFSESAKILIETLQNTEEGSPDGIQKISKYFTVGFFKDMEKYYDTVLKSERVKLDTKAEMLVFARQKAKMSAAGHTIQSNLEKERNTIHRSVGELVQERAYIQYMWVVLSSHWESLWFIDYEIDHGSGF